MGQSTSGSKGSCSARHTGIYEIQLCCIGADSDSEEELSEGEELRQAAAAAAAHSRRAAAKQEEVIVLTDSDDEDAAPPARPPARPPAPQHRPALQQHAPAASQGLPPGVRLADVWAPAGSRPLPASLQPSSSHTAPARVPPLPQVCIRPQSARAPKELHAVTLNAMQVLRNDCYGSSLTNPSMACRAEWGSSTHQLPGGQHRRRCGPRLRSQRRAFQASGPRRSFRAAASLSASPTGLQTHLLHQVRIQSPSGPFLLS